MGRPNVVDAITNGKIQLIVNTGTGGESTQDGYFIRRSALKFNVPYTTTVSGAIAMSRGVAAWKSKSLSVCPLQEFHRRIQATGEKR